MNLFENVFSDANRRLSVATILISTSVAMTADLRLQVGRHGGAVEVACLAVHAACSAGAILSKRYLAISLTVGFSFFRWFRL